MAVSLQPAIFVATSLTVYNPDEIYGLLGLVITDPVLFPKAFATLARFGRLVTSGGHAGGLVQIDINKLYLNQISIHGRVGFSNKDIVDSLQVAADGKFKILVDRVYPLRLAAEAHRRVDERSGLGKVILDPTQA